MLDQQLLSPQQSELKINCLVFLWIHFCFKPMAIILTENVKYIYER